MDDTLSETRVTCKKTKDGWDIESQPVNTIMIRNGQEVKSPLFTLLSKFIITYRLDNEGLLKDVIGYDRVIEAVNLQYSPEVAENLSSMLNIDAIKQREFTEWNRRIGDFLGKEFSIGDVWDYDAPILLPNGSRISHRIKTHFKEKVLHNNIICVLIEQTYDSTGTGINELMNDAVKSLSESGINGNRSRIKINRDGTGIQGKLTRLIDPSTMNIYKEEAERVIYMNVDVPEVGPVPVKMIEIRSYEYEYGR